ncbi:MAG TPA: hypothetical protein VLT56_02825 [Desulfobacterales bacterium]|jgi:hypothetical protein|nr:hypothetical protein [Desulfobacterales bacterium]HSM88931.1 hypothetical protein [Desulfobacterales bacterium]
MTNGINEIGQPIRFAVEGWRERPRPPRAAMTGQHCALEPLQPGIHAADLYAAFQQDKAHRVWTYMPYGPFHIFEDYRRWLESSAAGEDPLFHAVIDLRTSRATGVASYLNIRPEVGVVEVGHVNYSPRLSRPGGDVGRESNGRSAPGAFTCPGAPGSIDSGVFS